MLKLNVRGSISPKLMLQWTQAKCSEKSISSPSTMSTRTMPPAILSAVSTESVTWEASALSPVMSRSTTISKVCHFCLSRSNVSLRSWTSPFTRTLTNPAFRAFSNTSLCSPLRRCTIGAGIWSRVLSGRLSTESTICWTVWRSTGLPHL